MTTNIVGVALTPQYPLARSPEDYQGPRETGSLSRTDSSPRLPDSEGGILQNPVAAKHQTQRTDLVDVPKEGMEQSRMSPRSIDMKNGNGDNSQHHQNLASGRPRRNSGGGNYPGDAIHKSFGRSDHPAQIQFGSHGSMVVPSTIIGPPPRPPSPYNNLPPGGFIPPSHQQHHQHQHQHRRAESWSGNIPPMCPPSPSFQLPGNPMIPFMNEPHSETNPLLGGQQLNQSMRSFSSRRKRKSSTEGRGGDGHRRSLSSGAAHPGMYGQFFHSEGNYSNYEMPPPPPPPKPETFSPRSEFMKLTSSFRNTPPSPSSGKMMPPMSHYSVSPQGTPRSIRSTGKVAFSPHLSSNSPNRGYGSINVSSNGPPGPIPDFPMTTGGEAVFMAQKTGQGRHSHRESTRKRHMRQQSAQLFMEEVKGIEQPPACRDVIFLLLFLFHIVGIAFLGSTYGPEAMNNDTNTTVVLKGTEDEVHLYYSHLVYIAGMSGVFAVALSMLALGIMTAIARRFVQVALCLAIIISFAWGTIGIGLSPKNVVPITGFIALGLTVAYTFIVWDRIPFCAANLVTALSGIKANIVTLVIALSFQALSLAYCVYYTFLVVGVYDAIQEEKLQLSRDMQVFVYTMLGISFYWTYHVMLVGLIFH